METTLVVGKTSTDDSVSIHTTYCGAMVRSSLQNIITMNTRGVQLFQSGQDKESRETFHLAICQLLRIEEEYNNAFNIDSSDAHLLLLEATEGPNTPRIDDLSNNTTNMEPSGWYINCRSDSNNNANTETVNNEWESQELDAIYNGAFHMLELKQNINVSRTISEMSSIILFNLGLLCQNAGLLLRTRKLNNEHKQCLMMDKALDLYKQSYTLFYDTRKDIVDGNVSNSNNNDQPNSQASYFACVFRAAICYNIARIYMTRYQHPLAFEMIKIVQINITRLANLISHQQQDQHLFRRDINFFCTNLLFFRMNNLGSFAPAA